MNHLDDFLTTIHSDEGEHMDRDNEAPLRCLDGPDGCVGTVELRWPGEGEKQWPRCAHHGLLREAQGRANREKYPELPPRDFDPAFAGESWDEA